MTNLLAIVISIVATNTSELKTNIVENAFAPVLNNYFVIRATPVTEKWVTTTVEKIERLQFHWLGENREVVASTLISSNTVHFRIKQEWEQVPPPKPKEEEKKHECGCH